MLKSEYTTKFSIFIWHHLYGLQRGKTMGRCGWFLWYIFTKNLKVRWIKGKIWVNSKWPAWSLQIAGFHMTSLKFKLQNNWSSWDFTLMMYKSSWKLIFIKIFALNGFLVLWDTMLGFQSFCVTRHLHDGVIMVKKVTYFREFGYLNSSCLWKGIILMF